LFTKVVKTSSQSGPKDYLLLKDKSSIKKASKKNANLNSRQSKILMNIKKYKVIDMNQLSKNIPAVTTRTLRRDLLILQKLNLITKKGTTRSVKYYFN